MFATLESFSIFFFIGLALIILGVIFEEKLIAVENKIAKNIRRKKYAKKQAAVKKLKAQRVQTSKKRTSVSTGKSRMAA